MILNKHIHLWGGAALVFGNLLFIINKLNEMSRLFMGRPMPDVISGQNSFIILIGQAALIVGYIVYLQVYAPRTEKWGRTALYLFCGGGILLAGGHLSFISSFTKVQAVEYLFIFVITGLGLMLLGLIWFGILTLRQPILGRWPWLPLTTGLMGFIGFFLFRGEAINATFLVFRTLFALGLIGLGLSLMLETQSFRRLPPQRA